MPLHISDTRLAACLDALGFDNGQLNVTVHSRTRQTQCEVVFSQPSSRFPQLDAAQIVNHWKASRMLQPLALPGGGSIPAEPMHILAVMMRAQESYDAFLKLQRDGGHLALIAWPDAQKPRFCEVQWRSSAFCPAGARLLPPLEDLALAACLGPLGIGLIELRGSAGQHRYVMRDTSWPLLDTTGQLVNYRTADLIRFATSGPRRLALEDINPHHPLVMAYDSMQSRAHLKRKIETAKASLIITADDGTAKQALIALDYKSHVGEAVARHMKAPPGALDL